MATYTQKVGETDVLVVFRFLKESYLPGGMRPHVKKGWHYHYEAKDPHGAALCGVSRGPFKTLKEARKAFEEE